MVSHITEIGIEPNSAIAHGRHLGLTLNSAAPADYPVRLRRRSERRAARHLTAWHGPARRSARRKRAPGRDRTSSRPAGSRERAPNPPTECTRDTFFLLLRRQPPRRIPAAPFPAAPACGWSCPKTPAGA